MALVKASREDLEKTKRELSERTLFCDATVDEFIASGMDVARVDGFEGCGTAFEIVGNMRYRIKARGIRGVKVAARKGKVFLFRED